MLKLSKDLDVDNQVACWINHWVAYDPRTKIYLTRSFGRRKSGRKTRYYLISPQQPIGEPIVRFLAENDEEAYLKALTALRNQP